MEKQNKQNQEPQLDSSIETFKIPDQGTKENPIFFESSPDDLRGLSFVVEGDSGEKEPAFGSYEGYYMNDEGKLANIVGYGETGDVIEVIDGEATRSLAGRFLSGEDVIVARSDGSIDGDWKVESSVLGKKGEKRTLVNKVDQDGQVLVKSVLTDTLRKLNQSDVKLPNYESESNDQEVEWKLTDQQAALAVGAMRASMLVGSER